MGNYLDNLRDAPSASEQEQERHHPLYYDWTLPRWNLFRQTPEERAAAIMAREAAATRVPSAPISESTNDTEPHDDDWHANSHSHSLGSSSLSASGSNRAIRAAVAPYLTSSRSPSTVASSAAGLTDLERARSEISTTPATPSSSSSLDAGNHLDTNKKKLASTAATALRKIANKIRPAAASGSSDEAARQESDEAAKVQAKFGRSATLPPTPAPGQQSQAPKQQVSLAKSAIRVVKSAKEAIQKSLKSTLTSTIDTASKKPANMTAAASLSKKPSERRASSSGGGGGGAAAVAQSSASVRHQHQSMPLSGHKQAQQQQHQLASAGRDTSAALDSDDNGPSRQALSVKRLDSTRPHTIDVAEYGGLEDQAAIKAASNVHTANKRA